MIPDHVKRWNAPRTITMGFAAVIVMGTGTWVWGVSTKISGAVVASGLVQVQNRRQVVEHPTGGVVGDLLVSDGDVVDAGDIVLRLDNKGLLSSLAIIDAQLYEAQARIARLRAERDGHDHIDFPEPLKALAARLPEVVDQLEGQTRLFTARRNTANQQANQLAEQKLQIEDAILGLEFQRDALVTQLELLEAEFDDQKTLLDRGLTQAARVSVIQRELAQMRGQLGRFTTDIAQSRGRIAGIEIEILSIAAQRQEDSISSLRDLRNNELELSERKAALERERDLLVVRAPAHGVVFGSTVYGPQTVVGAGEAMMYIVPQDQPLVVSARVPAIHIDQVHIGQIANLRFTTFDQRTTPELNGHVSKLTADTLTDDRTGQVFYGAELALGSEELSKLGDDTVLLPGMPVEAFLRTGERTPMAYLTKPLWDYFNRAFRE